MPIQGLGIISPSLFCFDGWINGWADKWINGLKVRVGVQ
jgi:hypothetical protein